jgi:hypothetical protein
MIQLELIPRDQVEDRLEKVEKTCEHVRKGMFARHTELSVILKDHDSILMDIISRVKNLEESK